MTPGAPEVLPPPAQPAVPTESSEPEVKPLAAAARRLRAARKRSRGGLEHKPGVLDQVAAMAATGISQAKIARVLGAAPATVSDLLDLPQVQEAIQNFRAGLRHDTVQRLSAMHGGLMDWLQGTIKARDGKSFDQVSRGVFALEKTAASAAGDARRIDHSGQIDAPPTEGRRLLALLLGVEG